MTVNIKPVTLIILSYDAVLIHVWRKISDCYKRWREPSTHDMQVFGRYRDLFDDQFIKLLKTHNFAVAFQGNILDGFHSFMFYGLNDEPDYQFHNRKLEKLRLKVAQQMKQFLDEGTVHLDDTRNNGFLKVLEPLHISEPGHKEYLYNIQKTNELATTLYKAFGNLHTARNKHFDTKVTGKAGM